MAWGLLRVGMPGAIMNTHSQKLVRHLIASHLGTHEAPIEADGHLFVHALDQSKTVGDLVALVERWWQRGKAVSS